MKKILLTIFVTILLLSVVTHNTLAKSDLTDKTNINMDEELIWHDISELETLPYEETYSYDEMKQILINEGYSPAKIYSMLEYRAANSSIRYSLFSMKTFQFNDFGLTYKLQARFSVGLEYNGNNTPERIVSLEGVHIYTGLGEKCVFSGSIYYKLTSGNSFYYNFYGNIYIEKEILIGQ